MDDQLRHHLGLWLVLLVLLALNIGGSFLDLGAFNPALTLAIAGIQAFLIVGFFMHMRAAAPVPRIAAAAGFVWLLIMMGLTLSDYRTRSEDIALGRMLPEPSWESPPSGAVPTPLSASRDYRPEPPAPRPERPATVQAAGAAAGSADGEQVFRRVCSACHGQGLLGAPKVGDKAAWQPHAEHGMEMLVSHALNGYGAMPPKGGHPELSEQEVREAVEYMLRASGIELSGAGAASGGK
jgi:cytochrome c oxidase subunit 4